MEKRNYVRDDKGLKDDARDKYGVGEVGELVHGLSWPPRSYNCTFCKREFRSAQALGGHMNVHRRDRAMLRQVSSSQNFSSNCSTLFKLNLLHPNHNSNPSCNPNFPSHVSSNLSSTTTMLSPSFPSIGNASYRLCDEGVENLAMEKSHVPGFEFCKFLGFPCENENMIARNSEIVRWDSEISLLGESKSDDLDLELRLGCS